MASNVLWVLVGGAAVGIMVAAWRWWRRSRGRSAASAVLEIAVANAKNAEAERLHEVEKADAAGKAKTEKAREEVNTHADTGSNFADDPPFSGGSTD